jgi:hypothetical protein
MVQQHQQDGHTAHDVDARISAYQEKVFFFEKKKQKTFGRLGTRCGNATPKNPKVFWFFFSKKNRFPHPISRATQPG